MTVTTTIRLWRNYRTTIRLICTVKANNEYSPAENHFDLELRSKVFFFTDSGSADITFEESK